MDCGYDVESRGPCGAIIEVGQSVSRRRRATLLSCLQPLSSIGRKSGDGKRVKDEKFRTRNLTQTNAFNAKETLKRSYSHPDLLDHNICRSSKM
jgi:hypothetical protein